MPQNTNLKASILVILIGSLSLLLAACTRSPTPDPELIPTSLMGANPTAVVSLPIVQAPPQPVPAGIILEERALTGAPSSDPYSFTPVQGTMAEVLAKNEPARRESFPDNSFAQGQYFNMRRVTLDGKELVAREEFSPDGREGWVVVLQNTVEIYRIPVGPGSPVTPLRGLWTVDGKWLLETALINLNEANDPNVKFATGQLTEDGVLQNTPFGYTEIFGFQTLGGRPFYFFEKNGSYGFTYDGQVVEAGYTNIPHFECCSDAALNPKASPNLVSFFAQKGQTWYYVEIGVAAR